MINQNAGHPQSSSNFKQGMTLDEYLANMKTLPKQQEQPQPKIQENLYETSRNRSLRAQKKCSKKIITYEIRESDQDDYDQSVEGQGRGRERAFRGFEEDGGTVPIRVANAESRDGRGVKGSGGEFRVRRQSNSPYKQAIKQVLNFSPNKIFSQTLHANNDWRIHKDRPHKPENTSSTIYGKFLKGLKNPTATTDLKQPSQKQKYFKKKNTQELDHLAKYQKEMHEKYQRFQLHDLLSMRIQGVQDRLCERKIFNGGRKFK